MTTLRQVKRLLAPLVERHDDLVLVGHWLMLKPVRHLLRGVVIDRRGEAGRFMPRWAVANLCEPQRSFPITWGEMIRRLGSWAWADPLLQAQLFAAIEEQALPLLRAIQTLDDFFAFASSRERFPGRPFDAFPLRSIGVDVARGDLDRARATCAKLSTGGTMWSAPEMHEEFARITGTLCPLLAAGDRPGMARLLHEWEAYTVDMLKLGDIWEKTPFPIELPSAEPPSTSS